MNGPNSPNIIKVIAENLPDHIVELEKERTRIATRLVAVNRELATAYTLVTVVPESEAKAVALALQAA